MENAYMESIRIAGLVKGDELTAEGAKKVYEVFHHPDFSKIKKGANSDRIELLQRIAKRCTEKEFIGFCTQDADMPPMKLTAAEMQTLTGGSTKLAAALCALGAGILELASFICEKCGC